MPFFFSSRRRHTRWPRDWSSDVCSSDLVTARGWLPSPGLDTAILVLGRTANSEIGRASCRERVENAVIADGVENTQNVEYGTTNRDALVPHYVASPSDMPATPAASQFDA